MTSTVLNESAADLPRVVAIGFNKCATRSLARLFSSSGHSAIHQKLPSRGILGLHGQRKLGGIMRSNVEAGRPVFEGIQDHVFYGDLIDSNRQSTFDGNSYFREILHDYPGTILILNWRDREDWIRSRLQHGHGEFAAREKRLRHLETLEELCQQWREEWDRHLRDVRSYMTAYPGQLIEFNIDTDPVEALVAALPAYGLRSEHYGDIGRSRGRKIPAWLHAAKRWLSHNRPRTQV